MLKEEQNRKLKVDMGTTKLELSQMIFFEE